MYSHILEEMRRILDPVSKQVENKTSKIITLESDTIKVYY